MDATPVTTISVFTRHSDECPKRDDRTWRRCRCRKSLYVYENGKLSFKSAKTRSWEAAEKFAQELRDQRDPVKLALAKIEKQRAATDSAIADALDQWIKGMKIPAGASGYSTRSAYATFKRVVLAWAASKDFKNLSDVTPDSLDVWVGSWSPDAEERENRLKANTQKFRVARIKAFFKWAHQLNKVAANPAVMLNNVTVTDDDMEQTQPLTLAQFAKVMKATHKDTEFGVELRAIFLVQRWLGVRVIDALLLGRSNVKGNRIKLVVQKTRNSTGVTIDREVPTEVIDALNAVVPREGYHPDKYFTTGKINHRALTTMWGKRIKALNDHLDLTNEDELAGELGTPLAFRSHMLRDTFAVQLLLKGAKLQDVSQLLTHKDIRVTQRHYAKWSKERRDKLEDETKVLMRMMGATFAGD